MYLREAIERCARIEESIGDLYDGMAGAGGDVGGRAIGDARLDWRRLAERERQQARLLHVAAAAVAAVDGDGPFVVQEPLQLAALDRVVEEARRRLRSGEGRAVATGVASVADLSDVLEASGRGGLCASLLALARPAIAKALRATDRAATAPRFAAIPEATRPHH